MITAEQLRSARALVRMEQKELAEKTEISVPTIRRLEGASGILSTSAERMHRLQSVLEAAGVEFIPENGGGAGVRMKK
ncbi:helix-turn-helix transcriptional regulator [Paremcibacter congregatus]|uniref:helix-turn-helix domain-containing protein n=1 Tax=Paremcibacter congregatus TaxID=2043170 RepID=UPI0030ECC74B|tara:strand:+ start:1107 stop:1340 length:234 start_codon:yes stop_codon:yes gene_type:complete